MGEYEQEEPLASTKSAGLPTPPESPLNSTQEAGKRLEATKIKSEPEIPGSLSNLDLGICGSRTKTTGRPCNTPTSAGDRREALAKTKSLGCLTQCSHNLEADLRHLAEILHCRHHGHDPYLRDRVGEWKAYFPVGDNKINPDTSVAAAVKKIFAGLTNCCAGVNRQNKPCGNKIGGRKVQNRSKTIEEIAKPEIHWNSCELGLWFMVLESYMYCNLHQAQGRKQLEAWRLETERIRGEKWSRRLLTSGKGKEVQDPGKIDLLSTAGSYQIIIDSGPFKHSTAISQNSKHPSPAEFWPETYDTSPFIIPRKANHIRNRRRSYYGVQRQLQASLRKGHQNKGFLYAYEVEGNEGFVKIGYTTRTLEERHEEWSFDCNRLCKPIYPRVFNQNATVPNAARVEKLCHAELKHRNTWIYCTGCLMLHKEWFEVPSSEAIAVIEKWSKWMRSHPYQPDPIDASNPWTLRPDEAQNSINIGHFMTHLEQCLPGGQRLEDPEMRKQNTSSILPSQ